MFLIWITILVFMQNVTDGCSPFGLDAFSASRVSQPMPTLGVSSNPSETLFGHRARGQSTHLGALGTSSNPPIMDATELNCFDFDVHCKWRNMEGLFVDELDWFQGSGILDQGRLQVATGTHISPGKGMYAIVATDTVQMSTTKAVLVGDQIACQDGPAELKFKLLYIIADHFVFHAVNLQGGFAIIDDIEYIADMCPDTVMSRAASHNDIVPFSFSPMADGYPTTTEFATLAFPTLGVNTFDETVEKQLEPKQSLKFSPLVGNITYYISNT
uniref:Dirigent protein n=1 Tax=Heterorhabditis bacteriophora TaxID=37862 RepID=A0A1I7WZS7_HETBA